MTATLAVAGTAEAKAPAQTGGVVSGSATLSPEAAGLAKGAGADAHQRALAKYWTPDRMKSAKSDGEMPSVKARSARTGGATLNGVPSQPQGPATRIEPSTPKVGAQVTPSGTVQPQAFDPGYPVGHPVARTAGKVFFTSFGVNYVCSATVVNSEGKSEVWTAGHCVSDGQQWNYNWTFVPNYYNGNAPYGYWYAKQLWTTTAWFNNNNDFANDVGSAVMWRNNGWRITDYLGGQGISWNAPIGLYVCAFGYPQASPFNGQKLYAECGYTYDGGSGTIYMVNYMTGGSSGGAWLAYFDGQWGYINGHNDFKYNNLPQYMYSPYYGNQVANLYNTVRNISA
jgi:hypothetical protein